MLEAGELLAILSLAFGLGLLHALDADHVMAVTGLSSTRPGFKDTFRFCLRWAVGHGLTLLLIGVAVLLLGMAVPERLSAWAEAMVGVVLLGLGLYLLWDLIRSRAHFHFHQHDDLPKHAHWHRHHANQPHTISAHRHRHGAVMVGMLHGTAGSAPLLALLPLTLHGKPLLGIAYLLVFGLGVLLTMLLFGGLLSSLMRWLSAWGQQVIQIVRGAVAMGSMVFGGYLIHGTWMSMA